MLKFASTKPCYAKHSCNTREILHLFPAISLIFVSAGPHDLIKYSWGGGSILYQVGHEGLSEQRCGADATILP